MNAEVKYILQKLHDAGYEAYLVGGCVRDKLMGREIHDFDICTSALPDEVENVFSDHRIIETGLKHGTVTVVLPNDQYEITTFRADGDYSDGRHPDTVSFVRNLKDDLIRRDFTMNAIAFDGNSIVDLFGGVDDINSQIIRCVGNADARFQEDALRILRAMRFSAQLGFAIDYDTAEAMHRNKELILKVSAERIASELQKMIVGKNIYSVLHDFRDIIAVIIPEFLDCFDLDQKNDWHVYDVYDHICHSVKNIEGDRILRLAMLFHDIGKPQVFSIDDNGVGHFYDHQKVSQKIAVNVLKRLKFDNATIDAVSLLVYYHDRKIVVGKKSVRKLVSQIGHENAVALLKVKSADCLSQNIEKIREMNCLEHIVEINSLLNEIQNDADCISIKHLAVSGNDLKEIGLPPSPLFSTILNELLDKVINEELPNERDALIGYVQTHYLFKIEASIEVSDTPVCKILHFGKDTDAIEAETQHDIEEYCKKSGMLVGTEFKVFVKIYNIDFVMESFILIYRYHGANPVLQDVDVINL